MKEFKKLFAWQSDDMPYINTYIISHELNIYPTIKPITQNRKALRDDKSLTIRKELVKLLDMSFIKEIHF